MIETNIPVLPRLYYSTWGSDFYSDIWVSNKNCWMYSMIKFVEANIDLEKDTEALPLYEHFSGSDYIFMHLDVNQWGAAQRTFLEMFKSTMEKIPLRTKEVACVYPVDPFVNYFTYITTEKPKEKPVFDIYKLIDQDQTDSLDNLKHVHLETEEIEKEGLYIYWQFFTLHPESHHLFKVSNSEVSYQFETPDFGMPMLTMNNMKVMAKYDYEKLAGHLEQVWQAKEHINMNKDHINKSTGIFRAEQAQEILKGRKVAIFKYNKEAYGILRFHDILSYDTVVVFDDTVDLEDASTYIYSDKTSIPVVNDIDKIDEIEFDAVILTCSLNFESEVKFLKRIMKRAMKEDMPVISLYDDVLIYSDIFDESQSPDNFYKIYVGHQDISDAEVKKYLTYKPDKTLSVFGTDTVQGKFTTQIYLREALLKKGLNISHFATEPTGSLLNAEIGFSRLKEEDAKKNLAINRKLQVELEETSDLMITGGQNSIIYRPNGLEREENVSTSIFAQFQPNYIILTVSIDTSSEIITESLEYIEELAGKLKVKTRVLAFAMMGGRKIQGSRWTETYFMDVRNEMIEQARNRIEELTGIKVFYVPNEIDLLAEKVSEFIQ